MTIGGIGKACGAISGTPRTPNLQIHPDLEAFATPWPVFVTVVDSAGNEASTVFFLNVTDFPPFTQPKSPKRKAELAVSGLTKLGLAAIAGYLTVTGCPVFGPAAPACVSFMGGIGISQLIPGVFDVKAAFDPPDSAFRSIVAVAPKQLKPVSPGQLPATIATALDRVVANQAEQAGLADAYRRSNDKAAGAFFAGDTCWTRAQLHAAETFAQRKADYVALERPLRAALRTQLTGLPTFTLSPDQLQHLQHDIMQNGDDSPYIQALKHGTAKDDGASVMLRYMLQSAILDLRSLSGIYGLDLANTARGAATEEEEAAWRGLGQQRDWANFECDREGLTVRVNQTAYLPGQTLTTEATLFPPSASGSLVDAYVGPESTDRRVPLASAEWRRGPRHRTLCAGHHTARIRSASAALCVQRLRTSRFVSVALCADPTWHTELREPSSNDDLHAELDRIAIRVCLSRRQARFWRRRPTMPRSYPERRCSVTA